MEKLSGKNTRRKFIVNDTIHNVSLSVDSIEEQDFVNWVCEACDLSIIQDFQYQPEPFKLFNAVYYTDINNKQRCLFREHIYTPDFIVQFNPVNYPLLAKEFKIPLSASNLSSVNAYIDVKGTFAKHDSGRSFSMNQKWTWQKFGIFVSKIVPKVFCKKFGVATASMKSQLTKKARKMYIGYQSIKRAFNLI